MHFFKQYELHNLTRKELQQLKNILLIVIKNKPIPPERVSSLELKNPTPPKRNSSLI